MSKAVEAFRTISEVADELEVPKHVLRFWEARFPQLRPMKRGGGRRYYRPEDLDLLRGIRHLLHLQGYTIKGVQKILREQGIDQVKTCWRSGEMAGERPRPGRAVAEPPAMMAPSRPAGRTASRQPSFASRVVPPASNRPSARDPLTAEQRRVLEAVLRELESCRGLIAGTGEIGAAGGKPTQERPAAGRRTTARRGQGR